MVAAGLMDGTEREIVLEGDPATAIGFGITVEPDGGSDEPSTRTARRDRVRERLMSRGTTTTGSRHRLRRGRTARRPRRREVRPRHALRGRRPARRPRRHPRRRRRRSLPSTPASSSTTSAPTRPCSASSPSSASRPRSRRCRSRSATTRPGWSGPARSVRADSSRPPATCGARRTCGCSPRSRASTAAPARCSTTDAAQDQTLREFLADGRFSAYFARHFMEPVVAAVWSTDPELALDYPARYLFTFLQHHGMLSVFGSPTWRTVTGGSRTLRRPGRRRAPRRPHRHQGDLACSRRRPASRSPTATARSRRTTRASSPPTPTRPSPCWPSPRRSSARCSPRCPTPPTPRCSTPTPPCCRAPWAPARPGTSAGWPTRRAEVTVTYDLTRLQRLATDTHYLVTLGGDDLVDPATVIERRDYAHPIYTPESVAAQAPAARDRHRPARVRRRLPRLGLPRGRRPLRRRRRRAGRVHVGGRPPAVEPSRPRGGRSRRARPPWRLEPPARHGSTAPRSPTPGARRSGAPSPTGPTPGWSTSTTCPTTASLGAFEARDHLGDPDRSIRDNVEALPRPATASSLDGGRIVMAAMPRAFGFCFNPISVFWCFGPDGDQRAVVVEVHNTYGDRHAYLVHPDAQGRARTDKQMYVSPFHGTDGHYELAVPVPGDRLDVAVTLVTDDGTHASRASLRGEATRLEPVAGRAGRAPRRAADPGARRLAVAAAAADPATTRPPPGRSVPAMTLSPTRPPQRATGPACSTLPAGPRNSIASPIARSLFRAAASRLDVTVEIENGPGRREVLGRGGPSMRIHRPDEFYARIGRDGLIGFGEAYLTGAWDTDEPEDLGDFLTVLAAEMATLVPDRLQRARALVVAKRPRLPPARRDAVPRPHRPPLRPVERPVPAVPRPDPELLLGAVRDHFDGRPRADREPTSRRPRAARSSGCSTSPASARAAGSSRSAPAGASWRCAPPGEEPASTRSRSPPSSSTLARAARRRGRVRRPRRDRAAATTGRSRPPTPAGSTTRWCRSR